MKLTIEQVHFLSEALNSVNIPASNARQVADIQDILLKEFNRLQKLQDKENTSK